MKKSTNVIVKNYSSNIEIFVYTDDENVTARFNLEISGDMIEKGITYGEELEATAEGISVMCAEEGIEITQEHLEEIMSVYRIAVSPYFDNYD